MQPMEETMGTGGTERRRVEAVVETLATLSGRGESVAEVAHDARNMVTALGLYCDLLEEPGVLATPFVHYGNELRLVAAASRRLVEKLVALDRGREAGLGAGLASDLAPHPGSARIFGPGRGEDRARSQTSGQESGPAPGFAPNSDSAYPGDPHTGLQNGLASRNEDSTGSRPGARAAGGAAASPADALPPGRRQEAPGRWELMPAAPIENLAEELLASRNLLAALAGPSIALTVDVAGAARGVRMSGEDLTRVLVNLVKNAAEAMPEGGSIRISLKERPGAGGVADTLVMTVEDTGTGIPETDLEHVFASGYTTRAAAPARGNWPVSHRGLGLSITRSIVEASGGSVVAANRDGGGAGLLIELPVRKAGHVFVSLKEPSEEGRYTADGSESSPFGW